MHRPLTPLALNIGAARRWLWLSNDGCLDSSNVHLILDCRWHPEPRPHRVEHMPPSCAPATPRWTPRSDQPHARSADAIFTFRASHLPDWAFRDPELSGTLSALGITGPPDQPWRSWQRVTPRPEGTDVITDLRELRAALHAALQRRWPAAQRRAAQISAAFTAVTDQPRSYQWDVAQALLTEMLLADLMRARPGGDVFWFPRAHL